MQADVEKKVRDGEKRGKKGEIEEGVANSRMFETNENKNISRLFC